MLAVMSSSSRVAPMKMRASPPPAPRMKSLSLSSGSYSNTAGMLVMNVAIHGKPVMVASLRGGISVERAAADDRFGKDTDMPTLLSDAGCGPLRARRGARSTPDRGPLDHP